MEKLSDLLTLPSKQTIVLGSVLSLSRNSNSCSSVTQLGRISGLLRSVNNYGHPASGSMSAYIFWTLF